MGKAAGFLKRLKKVKDFLGNGLSWVNNNIVKPIAPVVKTVLSATGNGHFNKLIDGGMNLLDRGLEAGGYSSDSNVAPYVEKGIDIVMDTQRSPNDRKYLKGLPKFGSYGGVHPKYGKYGGVQALRAPFGPPIN